jgi:hypothetical protein
MSVIPRIGRGSGRPAGPPDPAAHPAQDPGPARTERRPGRLKGRSLLTTLALVAGTLTGAVVTTLAVAPAAQAGTVPPPPSGWNTVFSDDFAGAAGSAPSSANWFYDIGSGYGTGEIENTTSSTANSYLDGNGDMVLKAVDNGGTWTSARLESTRDDFEAPAGGQLEMTASIEQPNPANGLGYWPAFWALGSPMRVGGGWPQSGEIDMMEDVNGLNEASQTLHDSANSPGHALISCPTTGCQTGFNTYSVIINRVNTSAEYLEFLMDGTVESTITEASVGTTAWQDAIDHGFFIIWDLAMGGNYPDGIYGSTTPTSATSSGASMSVQYVAVYETGGNSTPTGTATATGNLTGQGGACLTNQNSLNTEGNPMFLSGCNGSAGQQWSPYSDGTVRVQGGCLDVVSAGTTSGTDVDWYPCNASNAQNWTHESNGELLNPNSNLCLTDPGGNTGSRLDIETCTDAADQQWTLPTGGGGGTGDTVTVANPGNQTSTVGTAASAQVSATDSASGQTLSYSATGLPAGLSINSSTGLISGTPTAAGTSTVTVTAKDGTGASGSTTFTWTVNASGGGGTGSPVTITASNYSSSNSVQTEPTSDTGGGNDVGYINSASWLEYANVNFGSGYSQIFARNASAISGTGIGSVQFRLDSLTATPFATVTVNGTGGWQDWVTSQAANAPTPSGTHNLYVTFSTSTGGNFVNVNWFELSNGSINGSCGSTNLALNKPTTASSEESASFPAANATDGNTGTRWSSAFSDPQWLEVDLGSTQTICQVVLDWETAYGTAFQIQTSNDNSTWTSIYSTTAGTGGTQTLNVSGSGRYIRMYGTARATQYGYSLWEFQVFG